MIRVESACKEKNIRSYITFRNSLRVLKANCKSEVSTSGFGWSNHFCTPLPRPVKLQEIRAGKAIS